MLFAREACSTYGWCCLSETSANLLGLGVRLEVSVRG